MRTLLHPASKVPSLTDLGLLVARLSLGLILTVHGWQKFNEWTIAGTAQSFEGMGVPAPYAAATFATTVELVGGVALLIGLFTPLVALLAMANMLGALVLVHAENGLFIKQNGFELVLAIFAGLSMLAVLGAGRFSLDALFGGPDNAAAGTERKERQLAG